MIRVRDSYKDHLWYPIVIKENGTTQIVEMQGKELNAWYNAQPYRRLYPLGCI